MSVIGPTPRDSGRLRVLAVYTHHHRENHMAARRKSAKRAGKKGTRGKGSAGKKRSGAKSASRSRTRAAAKKKGGSKKAAPKAPRAGRNPIKTVREAGEKTWEALKSTTAHVVEGVKGTFD
jgi:hypothetical protein